MLNQYKLDKNNFLFKRNGKLYEAPFGHGEKAIAINDRLPTARFEIYFTNSSATDPMTGECLPKNSQKRFFTDMPTDIEYITNAFKCQVFLKIFFEGARASPCLLKLFGGDAGYLFRILAKVFSLMKVAFSYLI